VHCELVALLTHAVTPMLCHPQPHAVQALELRLRERGGAALLHQYPDVLYGMYESSKVGCQSTSWRAADAGLVLGCTNGVSCPSHEAVDTLLGQPVPRIQGQAGLPLLASHTTTTP